MTFTVLPGQTELGELLLEIMDLIPYAGPDMPPPAPQSDVRISVLGVHRPDGTFVLNSQDPMAAWLAANDTWERQCLGVLVDVLEGNQGRLTLVSDNPSLPPRQVRIDILRYVPASRLKHSIFCAQDYHLESLRAYDGANICIESTVADAVRSTLRRLTVNKTTNTEQQNPKGGRPRKQDDAAEAYNSVFPGGHEGHTWKQVNAVLRAEKGINVSIDTLKRAVRNTEHKAKPNAKT